MAAPSTTSSLGATESTLREVVYELAPLQRRAGSEDERRAAQWLCERLRATGCSARVEEEEFRPGYAQIIGALALAGAMAGFAGLRRRWRRPAALLGAGVATAIADDVSNGPRLFRRAVTEPRTTWNVVAEAGDPDAERTLVVLGHHDAAQTGAIFDDRAQAWFGEAFPGILERIDTSLPLWWPVIAAPALAALGAARGNRALALAGGGSSLVGAAVFADIARRPVCPGANDNLTAVGALVGLAERLREEPVSGLRVLLVSCGAEEVLQGGIHGFTARHLRALDRKRTWVLNLETLGSPRLILLEGEGPTVMEDYHDRGFRDLIAAVAGNNRIPLRRGMRSRASTDSVIPSRAGYPTATLTSMDRHKALSNYHQMSDIPENVDYRTVAQALAVTEALARELAVNPWIGR